MSSFHKSTIVTKSVMALYKYVVVIPQHHNPVSVELTWLIGGIYGDCFVRMARNYHHVMVLQCNYFIVFQHLDVKTTRGY